jgi:hypothetical protein
MRFVPYERFVIRTQLSAEEALQALNRVVTSDDSSGPQPQSRPYVGKIEGYHFLVHNLYSLPYHSVRKRRYSPPIWGDIQPDVNGCSVCITTHSQQLLVFGMCLIGCWFCAVVAPSIMKGVASFGMFLVPAGFLVLFYLMNLVHFKRASAKTKSFFCILFQAKRMVEFEIGDLMKEWTQGGGNSSSEDWWKDRFTEDAIEESTEGSRGRAMIHVPYGRLAIHTQIHAEETLRRLENAVELYHSASEFQIQDRFAGYRSHRLPGTKQPYWGTIEGSHFRIQRNIVVYPGGFGFSPPPIEGDIQPEAGGSSISMTIYFHTLAIRFWAWVVGLPAFLVFISVINFVAAGQALDAFLGGLFVSLAMWFFICYSWVGPDLEVETATTKSFFCPLFQADRVDEVVGLLKKMRWSPGGGKSSLEGR